MITMLAAAGMAFSLLASPVPAAESAPPDRVTVEVITANGSGCPPGTSAVAVAHDKTAFTVTYSDYLAQVGVGAKPTDVRKNCQLALRIHYPQGFSYAIQKADYRGYANLQAGARGLQRANYYFQGMSATESRSHWFNGPYSDSWQATDTSEGPNLVYAPCGETRNLNVNTELRVQAGSSNPSTTTSFMTMDSTDGSIRTTYHFSWKRCD
ncbi:DUF4360 domain-containing protein [Crossiella sp. NPDC003009]